MKKHLIIAGLIAAVASFSAYGQGYMSFVGTKNSVFAAPAGTSGLGSSPVGSAVFLWAPVGTLDPLGAGLSTTAANTGTVTWNTINLLTSAGGWKLGVDTGTSATALGTVNPSGLAVGGIAYNGGAPFTVQGTSAGGTYAIIALAYNGTYGTSANLGWSSVFSYATGASSSDPNGTSTFNADGMTAFGVAPISVPEPTTLALAGLGGAALMAIRRRKA